MNQFTKMSLALLFITSTILYTETKNENANNKKKATSAVKAYQESSTSFQASLSGLSGQALIDALNKRNQTLSANIATSRKNIKIIHKNIGKHLVIVRGKSKSHLNKASKQQAKELSDNHKAISFFTQEMNHNTVAISQAQKALNQSIAMASQNQLTQYLQQNGNMTSGNGALSPALQTALNNALKNSYAQGQSDQSATDAIAIENAYNQGYNDAQNNITNSFATSSSNTSECNDSSAPSLLCNDGSTPSASNICSDGSTPTMLCSDGSIPGSTSAYYTSSCDDGSNATCSDGTNLSQKSCDDQSAPDINGMCADGSFVTCNNGQSPICADGNQPQ